MKSYKSVTSIYTYSDNSISDGGLYRASGFVEARQVKPTYSYLIGGRRVHKFSYRKSRFLKDPNLKHEEGLTERQLAELNSLPRIYDYGKIRWERPN